MVKCLSCLLDQLQPQERKGVVVYATLLLFAAPAVHPLLIPLVGVPSHLLWFAHALPVALVAHGFGRRGAAAAIGISMLTVAVGEHLFGAGYGHAARTATVLALATAVGLTDLLIAWFALAVREAELRRRVLELQTRRAQTLTELGTVIASIAHELNNPIGVVMTFADLVRQAPHLPSDLREDIDVLAGEAQRVAAIARQLLRLVRDGERPRQAVQLNGVVERVLRARGPSLSAHGILASTALAPDLPSATAVAEEIEQILTNLIVNAEQAMQAGRGRGSLVVRSRADARFVFVDVEDDGPGITTENLRRLFEPFFTTKPVGVGTGLGLSIARRMARSHGGDLVVASSPGRGATFTLRLPRDGLAPTAEAVRTAPATGPKPSALRVLVVDDEPGIRRALKRLLTQRGHRVLVASDAEEARRELRTASFDRVLCDVHLGADSGVDLYRQAVAEQPELSGRFVFVTGDALSPELAASLAASQSRHLTKPFEAAELVAAVEEGHAVAGAAA